MVVCNNLCETTWFRQLESVPPSYCNNSTCADVWALWYNYLTSDMWVRNSVGSGTQLKSGMYRLESRRSLHVSSLTSGTLGMWVEDIKSTSSEIYFFVCFWLSYTRIIMFPLRFHFCMSLIFCLYLFSCVGAYTRHRSCVCHVSSIFNFRRDF